jgi:hypothetical protein
MTPSNKQPTPRGLIAMMLILANVIVLREHYLQNGDISVSFQVFFLLSAACIYWRGWTAERDK